LTSESRRSYASGLRRSSSSRLAAEASPAAAFRPISTARRTRSLRVRTSSSATKLLFDMGLDGTSGLMRTSWLPVAALLLPLSCQPAAEPHEPAPPPTRAEALVAKWAAALGGAARLAQIQEVHRSASSLEDGLAGTREEWIGPGLQRKETIDHVHDRS